MKKILILIFLLAHQLVYSQAKTYKVSGSDYIKLIYSTLYFFENYKDSLKQTSYGIFDDSLIRMWNPKVIKKIDNYGQFTPLKVSDLDSNFNLLNELNHKVYLLRRADTKDCFFLKDEKTLVRKTLQKSHIWQQVAYSEYKIYKVDLGNNRIIFWANGLGIIYKINNELKTNFLPLEYFYSSSEILIKDLDSVNMETGYFDFGVYKIRLKHNANMKKDRYTVTKGYQVILDDLSLKYYNNKTLIAYDNDSLKFFNIDLGIDSQFRYRDYYEGWDGLEFLIKNEIKKVSIQGYIPTFQKNINGVCGTVAHYTLKLNRNNATLISNREIVGGTTTTQNIPIVSKFDSDSMVFITHQKEMSWSDNGGFNDQIILFRDGKEGLYNFSLKDSLVILKEILPKKFNSIHLVAANLVLSKNGQEDFFNYYIENKKMRFRKISYERSTYLRYKKLDKTEGWIDSNAVLFDDK